MGFSIVIKWFLMGIVITHKGSALATSGVLNPYGWTLPTPSANGITLLAIANSHSSGAVTPTVTGAGMTWTQIATIEFNIVGTPTQRLTLFRALNSTWTGGSITINFGAQNPDSLAIWSTDASGVILTGTNGSDAIVQVNTNADNATFHPVVTLSSAITNNNYAVVAWFANNVNPMAITPDAGWTEIFDSGIATPDMGIATIYDLQTLDNSPSAVEDGPIFTNWGGIAVELKPQYAGGMLPHFF
jgi:hypothetical protein